MTGFDDLPFYDYDPGAREQATAASRARVKEGFTNLIAALQAPLAASREAQQRRWRENERRINTEIGRRDGHFIPEGCSILISPDLARRLGTNPQHRDYAKAPT